MYVHVFDTETTGIGTNDGPCEIGIAVIQDDFEIVWQADSYIDAGVPIGPGAGGVHGITDEMVKDAPTLEEFVAMKGYPFRFDDLILCAHNVQFDIRMTRKVLPERFKKLCTLKLARTLWPDLENHQLQTLKFAFKLESGPAHRAMGDVITCVSLLRHAHLTKGLSLAEMVDLCNQPLSLDTKLTFGKHKGTKLSDLPKQYISWALREMTALDPDLRVAFERLV